MVHWITFKDPSKDDYHAQDLLSMSNVKHWRRTRLAAIEGDLSGVTGIKVKQKDHSEPL